MTDTLVEGRKKRKNNQTKQHLPNPAQNEHNCLWHYIGYGLHLRTGTESQGVEVALSINIEGKEKTHAKVNDWQTSQMSCFPKTSRTIKPLTQNIKPNKRAPTKVESDICLVRLTLRGVGHQWTVGFLYAHSPHCSFRCTLNATNNAHATWRLVRTVYLQFLIFTLRSMNYFYHYDMFLWIILDPALHFPLFLSCIMNRIWEHWIMIDFMQLQD